MPRSKPPTNAGGRIARRIRTRRRRYDARSARIIVDLTNGATFAFPPHLVQGLEDATPAQLAEVEVLGAGGGLHWETLDVDFSVPGLVDGVFGTAKWMAARRPGARPRPPRQRRRGRTGPRWDGPQKVGAK